MVKLTDGINHSPIHEQEQLHMGVDLAKGPSETIVTFYLSGAMTQYAPDITRFVGLMLEKLEKNLHKGKWEDLEREKAFDMMLMEVSELIKAMSFEGSPEVVRECADIANFAMIIASITERGVANG